MIDQLIKLVQQNAGDAITKNPAIPNQYKDDAVKEVGQQIFGGIQNQVQQGNIQEVMSLFKTGNLSNLASNPIVTQIVSSIAFKFASKFGVSPQIAQQIASGLVPKVINQFVSKTNDPNDKDFDLQDVIKNFGGGGISDILGQFGGGGGKKDEGLGGMMGKLFGN